MYYKHFCNIKLTFFQSSEARRQELVEDG